MDFLIVHVFSISPVIICGFQGRKLEGPQSITLYGSLSIKFNKCGNFDTILIENPTLQYN